jgi:S-adenosylmethionine/arginine decarboxylase-like enzyme
MEIIKDGVEYFGKHFIVDVFGCSDVIHDVEFWKKWFNEIVVLLNMEKFGEALVYEFGEGDLHGLSGVQFIHTSSITMHNQKPDNGVHLDIFSCKDYDERIVMEFIKETLKPNTKKTLSYTLYR